MTFDLGFGNLIANGKKIDWESIKKYDENSDGKIDGNEYTNFLNEVDSDGFNGVSAFGTMDADGDGVVTDEEFELLSQKVEIQDYVDEYMEEAATDGDLTTEYQAALKLLAKTYIDDNTTSDITFVSGETGDETTESKTLFELFKEKLESFKNQYADLKDDIDDIKNDKEKFDVLQDTVTEANENGYISKTEEAAIRSASTDYAMQQILKGDFSYLENIGATDKEISILKKMVASMMSSSTPDKALSELKSAVNVVLADVDNDKYVFALAEKTTQQQIDSYTINVSEVDFSSIDGYAANQTVNTENGDYSNFYGEFESSFMESFKSQIIEQCASSGVEFNEDFFQYIFDKAEELATKDYSKDYEINYSEESSVNITNMMNDFVQKFNSLMESILQTRNAAQSTDDGIPTVEAMKSNALCSGKNTFPASCQARIVCGEEPEVGSVGYTSIANEFKSLLKENLGDNYDETKASALLASVNLSLYSSLSTRTYMDVVKAMINRFKSEYGTE